MQFGISTKDLQRLTLLPESLVPHSPLSYHHLFFSLSKMPCSLSFNTARFTGVLHVGNNINNIVLCYFMLFNFLNYFILYKAIESGAGQHITDSKQDYIM